MSIALNEYHERIKRIGTAMEERGLTALLIWGDPHGSYGLNSATNDTGYVTYWPTRQPGIAPSLLILPKEGDPTLVVSGTGFTIPYAKDNTWIQDVRSMMPAAYDKEAQSVLTKMGLGSSKIGLVRMSEFPVWFLENLKKALPTATFEDAAVIFKQLRVIKTAAEIEIMRDSARLGDRMFETVTECGGEDVRRQDILAKIEYAARMKDAEFAGNWISVGPFGGDHNTSEPHQNTKKLRKGDLINLGIYVVFKSYWGHAIRAFVVGKPTKEQTNLFQVVLEAQNAVLDVAKPGHRVSDLHNAAQSVYSKAGYEASFRVLHGLGLSYAEAPLSPQPKEDPSMVDLDMELKSGMVFELHPNIWAGPGGGKYMNIGDMVLVTSKRPEILTKFARELVEI